MQSSRYARPATSTSGGVGSAKAAGTPNRRQFGNTEKGVLLDGVWMCDCNPRLSADKFQVKKDTVNKGRWFYTCQKADGKKCGFFLWEDDAIRREKQAQDSSSPFKSIKGQPLDTPTVPSIQQQKPSPTTPSKYAPPVASSIAEMTPNSTKTTPVIQPESPSQPSTSGTVVPDNEVSEVAKDGKDSKDDEDAFYDLNSDEENAFINAATKADEVVTTAQDTTANEDDSVETPRKASRTNNFSTPGAKRNFQSMMGSSSTSVSKGLSSNLTSAAVAKKSDEGVLATPPTTLGKRKFMDSGLEPLDKGASAGVDADAKALDDAFLDLVSPLSTPTRQPISARRNLNSAFQSSLLTSPAASTTISVEEIAEVLKSEDSSIPVDEGMPLWKKLEQLCTTAARRTRGVIQSRDITRKALVARDNKIAELEHRIRTLESELDTDREIIRVLRDQDVE